MEDFFAELPFIGGLFDDSEENYLREQRAKQDFLRTMRPEDIHFETFTPEDAAYTLAQEDPRLRGLQDNYLDRLFGLSESGLSDADAAGFAQAEGDASRAAKQSSDAIIRQMQSRGIGGSGQELALRQMAADEARNRALDRNLTQAGDTARQRAVYAQAYGGALGGMRDQDYRAQRDNTDVINRFTANNTQARNQARQGNIERKADTHQRNIDNRMGWAGKMAGTYDDAQKFYAAQGAARADARQGNMDTIFKGYTTFYK